jgi:DNA-binding response OmpR family regulator
MRTGPCCHPTTSSCARTISRQSSPLRNRKVLIVEDDADTRAFLRIYLEHAGFEPVTASNGRDGLSQVHAQRPTLILLDLSMPVMTGWEFRAAQQALADRELAGVPVVIISALIDCEDHGLPLGAAGVVPKPIDCDRLLTVLNGLRTAGTV